MKLIEKCPRNSLQQQGNQIVLPLEQVPYVSLMIGDIVLWTSGICKTTYASQKIIVWSGSLENQISKKIIDALRIAARKDTDPIWLIIDSDGGYMGEAFDIINEIGEIKANGIKVITVNIRIAHSSAGLVAISGSSDYRYMKNDSSMLVHKPGYSTDYLSKQIKKHPSFYLGGPVHHIIEEHQNLLRHGEVNLVRHLNANSRMSVDSIDRLLQSNNGTGTYVKIQEAKQNGFCDKEIYGIDISKSKRLF